MNTSVIDLFNYKRLPRRETKVGNLGIGGPNAVRIQSMATASTDDTLGCIAQAKRIIDKGGELVRFTTQGLKEARNLKHIKAGLLKEGYQTPIVADVHFNPNVADVAVRFADKVRINPGNYVDPARRFVKRDYTEEEYQAELKKIEERLIPFLNICKKFHRAVRIGVNHGSLSDRIRNRYGDTPQGIVESCMEFLRVCKRQSFHDIVISIKASNTVVMVRSVRLLIERMQAEDMDYPIHLGVTEAGEGEDGRIKSAVGIGALLADGIGDTIRVSLSEEPEAEIPVARRLADHFKAREGHTMNPGKAWEGFNWASPERRITTPAGNIGGEQVPIVIANTTQTEAHKGIDDSKADYLYTGQETPLHLQPGKRYILDFDAYARLTKAGQAGEKPPADSPAGAKASPFCPIFPVTAMPFVGAIEADVKFLVLHYGDPSDEYIACLKAHPEVIAVCVAHTANPTGEQRAFVHELMNAGVKNPVVFAAAYEAAEKADFQLDSAADMGPLMMDGMVDGLWLLSKQGISRADIEDTALAILQAGRLRMTRTEYISCPGCGRTLYNLQDTIARIKEATRHMQGLKIAIMGCIVNGPGEMADADYGYVGAGAKRVSLYKGKTCVEKNIPEEEAVERLLALIKGAE